MNNTNKENMNEKGKNQSATQQAEHKPDKSSCGCGCKTSPVHEEVVEFEEDDFSY